MPINAGSRKTPPNRMLMAGTGYWRVEPEAPLLEQGRVVYEYVVEPLGEPAEGEGSPQPQPTAYADEVLEGVRRDWDDFNAGFGWLTTLFPADVQARAFGHRGGAAAAARATQATAVAESILGLYSLSFLPGGPAADPLAPATLVFGVTLAVDGVLRLVAARRGVAFVENEIDDLEHGSEPS